MQTAEGQIIEGPLVVELKEDGTFLSYHILQQEEPATEWVGGTYVNSKFKINNGAMRL
jgi:hypothetical protein